MRAEPDRVQRSWYRLALTPAGAGVLSLFFPGLLIAAVARQRLLVAVCIGAGALLALNAVIARIALYRVSVYVALPSTTTTGLVVPLQVTLDGPELLECVVGATGATRTWTPAIVPCEGTIDLNSDGRGVVDSVHVKLQTAVPFGLTAFIREVAVPLAEPMHVAPASIVTPVVAPPARGPGQLHGEADPIGLRPYGPGDRQRDVHWPTVARTGEMMVVDRRVAASPAEVAVIVAETSSDSIDQALARTRATVEQLLASGYPVELTTCEQTTITSRATLGRRGPKRSSVRTVTAPVLDRAGLLVRLARASAGNADNLSIGPYLTIAADGASWVSAS